MRELKMNKSQLTECIAAFSGVFTGVFAALLPHASVEEAFARALDLANKMEADGCCQKECGINNAALFKKDESKVVVEYQSRSGNEYKFEFSNSDWYACKLIYQEHSCLSHFFKETAEKE